MAKRFSEATSITVDRGSGCVVLTMTPQRAQWVADSIELGDTDHAAWLNRLTDLLRSAAGSAGGPRDAQAGSAATPELKTSPQFAKVLALAAQAELIAARDLEELAVVAATVTEAAVAAAATETLHAADAARNAQAAVVQQHAVTTAQTVRRAAHLLRLHTEEEAETVASAAAEAAARIASATVPGTEADNAETAAFLAATIRAAAVAKAEEAALAAATVARAAATAAADAAADAADAAMALELQVADTAAAVHAVAIATARRVAAEQVTAAHLILDQAKLLKLNVDTSFKGLRRD